MIYFQTSTEDFVRAVGASRKYSFYFQTSWQAFWPYLWFLRLPAGAPSNNLNWFIGRLIPHKDTQFSNLWAFNQTQHDPA